jgi:hypothetical protein
MAVLGKPGIAFFSKMSTQTEDINLDLPRSCLPGRKVYIGIPIMFWVDPNFMLSLMRLPQDMQMLGLYGELKPHIGDSAVGRARNSLTRKFLESDCTHLLMIDSDLVFSAQQVQRIMSYDEPIVAGLYYKKQEGEPQPVINACENPIMQDNGLYQVKYAGTGFLRIAREVFERMIDVYGDEIGYSLDHAPEITEYDFWQMGVYKYPTGKKRWLSEDWYWCQRATDLGYKIWVDRGITLRHSGNCLYPLSYQEKQIFGHRVFSAAGRSDTVVKE